MSPEPLSPRPPTESHFVVIETQRERKREFEWNLVRLLYRQPGETEKRAWVVRVLSCALVIPVALTAIVDLGRGIGFLIGDRIPEVAKYFTGESWSSMEIVLRGYGALQREFGVPVVAEKVELMEKFKAALRLQEMEELRKLSSEKEDWERAFSIINHSFFNQKVGVLTQRIRNWKSLLNDPEVQAIHAKLMGQKIGQTNEDISQNF